VSLGSLFCATGASLPFNATFLQLQTRIALFLALPIESIDRLSLRQRMEEIGGTKD
jgi:hypothetical protein